MDVDLHGYHPDDIDLAALVREAWETGAPELTLIHGHGRHRGISPGFVNTNTGYFGLRIRSALRRETEFKQWIKRSTLYCGHEGSTTVKLKPNPKPTRVAIDMDLVGPQRHPY
ncbi:MAG: Smr/MutS family protein [Pseudolabrys sp.]